MSSKNHQPSGLIRSLLILMILIIGIFIIAKAIHQAYTPYRNRLFELIIICNFLVWSNLLLALHDLCVCKFNHIHIRGLRVAEGLVLLLGIIGELMNAFPEYMGQLELFELNKVISALYLITAVIGHYILYNSLMLVLSK